MSESAVADIGYADLHSWLQVRKRDAHKGQFGHVLVVGGDHGFGGAALVAAEAAARCGAGLTSVATRPEHLPALLARRPELMARGIDDVRALSPLLEAATVLVIGPGLGREPWGRALLSRVLAVARSRPRPLLLDADALNLLAEKAEPPAAELRAQWLLTPHPGEAGRLLGCDSSTIQDARESSARELQKRWGGTVVLKGAGSLIAWRDEQGQHLARCRDGNPGMASGGMGDILSGVIGALLAQGLPASQAARLGVCLHAASADRAAQEAGERGLLASDLLPWLQRLANPENQP